MYKHTINIAFKNKPAISIEAMAPAGAMEQLTEQLEVPKAQWIQVGNHFIRLEEILYIQMIQDSLAEKELEQKKKKKKKTRKSKGKKVDKT